MLPETTEEKKEEIKLNQFGEPIKTYFIQPHNASLKVKFEFNIST